MPKIVPDILHYLFPWSVPVRGDAKLLLKNVVYSFVVRSSPYDLFWLGQYRCPGPSWGYNYGDKIMAIYKHEVAITNELFSNEVFQYSENIQAT